MNLTFFNQFVGSVLGDVIDQIEDYAGKQGFSVNVLDEMMPDNINVSNSRLNIETNSQDTIIRGFFIG